MVRELVKDPIFLGRNSRPAEREDLPIAQDLRDTLEAHLDRCVGMAANMIGQAVRIIAFRHEGETVVMLNPEIVKSSGQFETEEGCLCLEGLRRTKRFRSVKVRYQNEQMQLRLKTFTGWSAQIIQHETDHCCGILI